ncbi:LuxR C-terminal-related transcriptional regulator [Streptomyces sp. NPDC004069]
MTRRQRQVLVLAANGNTNTAIARRLGIHRSTVDRHFAEAYAKLGARDGANAVALAARSGQIDLTADVQAPDTQR